MRQIWRFLATVISIIPFTSAIELDVNSVDSIKSAAGTIAYDLVKLYHGNESGQVPGLLPGPYYWWECGAMFNSLINYWYYTGDTSYNKLVKDGMQFQVGPDNDFMTHSEGNDDQVFWAFSAMSAAELGFDDPVPTQPQWLALAQAVFNRQAARWDTGVCNGGLRWQIYTWNPGWTYKNSPSNGGLFNLAARLGAYTGNHTYFDWADKVWTWMNSTVHLIGPDFVVYDGTSVDDNCTSLDHTRWTYTQGMLLHGAAVMHNATGEQKWRRRTEGLWNATAVFWTGHDGRIMRELCEILSNCNVDQQSFKAYLSRFMAAALKVAPYLHDTMVPFIRSSATAAAAQCSGLEGTACGMKWTDGPRWDGETGVGQQMAALEIVGALLVDTVAPPVADGRGGTSQGDPNAGTTGGGDIETGLPPVFVTDAEKAGASILTALLCLFTVGGSWWIAV